MIFLLDLNSDISLQSSVFFKNYYYMVKNSFLKKLINIYHLLTFINITKSSFSKFLLNLKTNNFFIVFNKEYIKNIIKKYFLKNKK